MEKFLFLSPTPPSALFPRSVCRSFPLACSYEVKLPPPLFGGGKRRASAASSASCDLAQMKTRKKNLVYSTTARTNFKGPLIAEVCCGAHTCAKESKVEESNTSKPSHSMTFAGFAEQKGERSREKKKVDLGYSNRLSSNRSVKASKNFFFNREHPISIFLACALTQAWLWNLSCAQSG